MDDKKAFFNGFDDDILNPEDFEEEDDVKETPNAKGDDDKTDETTKSDNSETDEEEEEDGTSETEEEEEEQEKEADEKKDDDKSSEAAKNAEFARKRREREARDREAREAQIKKEAKLEAELGLIKTNPYTEQPIKDEQDLEVYKVMKEIDDAGGDPITDLPAKMAELNRTRASQEKSEREKQEAVSKKLKAETAELHQAYPDLNLSELGKDEEFLNLCEEKEGRWTMLECYEYLTTKRKADKEIKENDEAVEKSSKKVTKTPSANSNGGKSEASDDYMEMTDEEFLKREHKESGDFF